MAQQRWCEEDDVRRDRRPFRPRRHENPGHDEARVATASASATGMRFVVPRAQELLRQERVTLSQLEKRSGCVYLDVRRTQQDIDSNRNPHENQLRGAFAGRRFEIYSTRDNQIASDDQEVGGNTDNTGKGKTNRQVNEDEEFCSISAMTLGGKRLVVAAEIDCYDDDGGANTAANKYVELKTFRLLQRQKDQFVFERFKLLAFWIQSYLVGTPKIVCAFRNDSFEVRKLQTFRTTDIPGFCHKHWVSADSSGDSDHPGICEDTEDCTTDGYECVALQTTRADTETVKQCLPKEQDTDVCSGQYPGLCPTFSSWVSPYNQISSVCTYKPADECITGSTSGSEGVNCISGATDASGESIDVIYGCVDFDTSALEVLFGDDDADDLASDLDTASALVDNCLDSSSSNSSSLLCSGQGTCLPDAVASLNYTCRCNEGYNGTYCDTIESNMCQLPGQCATGECNLETNECECAEGTTGDQCSECDATSSEACNGKGTCSNATCTCKDGWEGLQCTKESTKTSESTTSSDSSSDGSSSAAPLPSRPLSYVAMAVAVILATALFH
ncbi:hypothetical protein BBJ28_00000654 [Nothophytophthora sp. Chile5]|nr:hypothetical protein BBJ28_00000654 [Nothophytophthora sp. Chile5]